jgi:hypothetical protein
VLGAERELNDDPARSRALPTAGSGAAALVIPDGAQRRREKSGGWTGSRRARPPSPPLSHAPNRRLLGSEPTRLAGEQAPVRWALPIVCLLAAGCSLPATLLPTSSAPGDDRVGGGIVRIVVPKGALADCASADECTLVKAAEATQRAGATHFMLLPGHGGPTQRGHAYIKVFSLAPGEGAPSGTMSVEEALYFFRRRPGQVAS